MRSKAMPKRGRAEKTSAWRTSKLGRWSCLARDFTKATHLLFWSMASTDAAPRLQHSTLRLPVPQKRSSTRVCSQSRWFCRTLKRASLAKSVVGLTGNPAGTCNLLPFRVPPTMRITKCRPRPNGGGGASRPKPRHRQCRVGAGRARGWV